MSLGALDGSFALDVQGLERLRHSAAHEPAAVLAESAAQFEAIMLQMMLKSMRDATPRAELFDSSAMRLHQSLLDQQWAQHLSRQGLGLAEQLVAQLRGNVAAPPGDLLAGIPRGVPTDLRGRERIFSTTLSPEMTSEADDRRREPGAAGGETEATRSIPSAATRDARAALTPKEFIARLREPAETVARVSGIPVELMLAQAALETGWGRYRIPTVEGGDSHNLFGIKAGSGWQGETTSVTTHEYVAGKRIQTEARFRVYDSYEAAFADYAGLVGGDPRYRAVAVAPSAEQAARELQAAGYATDPAYADKLISLIARSRQLTDSG